MHKKMKLVVMVIAVAFINFIGVQNVFSSNSNEMVEALNIISLVQGDNGNYNLDGVLKRSEAATLMVRIMGEEDEVLRKRGQYKITKFKDVSSGEWYAPYIGYCSEIGIIDGYLDGTFRPEEVLTEKAMLKLLMGTLGYIYEKDFIWDNIFESAYNLGIVKDPTYADKQVDSVDYKREKAFEAVYNTLSIEIKGQKLNLIQKLVEGGSISKESATQSGLFKDDLQTEILSIVPTGESQITVKLNEPIFPIEKENIHLYSLGNIEELPFEIESQSESEIIIKTPKQDADSNYGLEISEVRDIFSNLTKSLNGNFSGYRSPEVKSDFFKISKAQAISKNLVHLYFTHPINANAELPTYYEILQGNNIIAGTNPQSISVRLLGDGSNGVAIYLKEKVLTENMEYIIKVKGNLNSNYGVQLKDGKGDSTQFKGVASETEEFKMLSVSVVNGNTISLYFNKEVNPVLGKQIFNYYITDSDNKPIQINSAIVDTEGESKGRVVRINVNGFFDKLKSYNIMVNYITDFTRQYSITEKEYTFSGYYPDKVDMKIINAVAIDATTLMVHFDRALNAESAIVPSNYLVSGITHNGYYATPLKVYYEPLANPYMVKLFMPSDKAFNGFSTYKLTAMSTLKDYMGNTPNGIVENGFNANGSTASSAYITEAVIIGKDAIKVKLNKEISLEAPNILPSNYKIEYVEQGMVLTKIPLSVNYIDGTTLVLKFDELHFETNYKLKFDSLRDYAGNTTGKLDEASKSIEVVMGEQ